MFGSTSPVLGAGASSGGLPPLRDLQVRSVSRSESRTGIQRTVCARPVRRMEGRRSSSFGFRSPVLGVRVVSDHPSSALDVEDYGVLAASACAYAVQFSCRHFVFTPSHLLRSGVVPDEVLAHSFDDFKAIGSKVSKDADFHQKLGGKKWVIVRPNVRAKLAPTAWRAGQQAQNGPQAQRLMASVPCRWGSA